MIIGLSAILIHIVCTWNIGFGNIFAFGQSIPEIDKHNKNAFLQLYDEYVPVCSDPKYNIVLPRYDNYNIDYDSPRQWSLNAGLVHEFIGLNVSSPNSIDYSRPLCKSAQEVAFAISHRILHLPCRLSWLSQNQICHIFHKYRTVYWMGDSLTRHMTQALFMLLKGDLRYGGIPTPQSKTIFDECACDGQFSEALKCRIPMHFGSSVHDSISWTSINDLREYGFCSTYLAENSSSVQFLWAQNDFKHVELSCPDSPGLVFIFFQGGHHVELSSWYMITTFLQPIMSRFKQELGLCWDRVRLVFSGATVCSDEVVKKYPHQNRDNVDQFNKNAALWLNSNFPEVHILNYYNISAESVDNNRTSDGFHSLSDMNLIKALTVITMMFHMSAL